MTDTFEVTIRVKGKRPKWASPEMARLLRRQGKSVVEIAHEWGISRAQVYNILKQP